MAERYRRVVRNGRRVLEHRWVMEQHLGYPLPSAVHVHHKNGDRYDNRLENLECIEARRHAKLHAPDKYPRTKACGWCGKEFVPAPTKRKRAMACCYEHGRELAARARRSLTNEQARDLKAHYLMGYPQTWLARRFGVTQATVWEILRQHDYGSPVAEWIGRRMLEAVQAQQAEEAA